LASQLNKRTYSKTLAIWTYTVCIS
jgi:hypothetical protein